MISQDDKPVVFFCEQHNRDHVWHEDCLPIHLAEQLMHMRTAVHN